MVGLTNVFSRAVPSMTSVLLLIRRQDVVISLQLTHILMIVHTQKELHNGELEKSH